MSRMKDFASHGRDFNERIPCPMCRRPTKGGYCFYCGAGERPRKSEEQRLLDEARALAIWNEGQPIKGTLAGTYLKRRGITIEIPDPDRVLRFHPSCPFGKQRIPCMIALVHAIDTEPHRPCAVHRTSISGDGQKLREPWVLGTFWKTAIKLWPEPVNGKLTIGEGIETVLSAVQLKPDLAPAWATGTAANLGAFPNLDSVTELRIAVDNDPKEHGRIGQKRAKQVSGVYAAWAKKATLLTPKLHKDLNDVLMEIRNAGPDPR